MLPDRDVDGLAPPALVERLADPRTHTAAEAALRSAAREDPSPAVRKKAAWYLPGGPIHRRTG